MTDKAQRKCFTIMPFTVRDGDLTRYHSDKSHWHEVYQGLIVPAVQMAGLQCERDDEDIASRLIVENIWRKIEDADVVLCDLSSQNPNVYLELGWTLRADKRFVLIKDDITHFNFDLNQVYTYEYSHLLQPSKVRDSITELSNVLAETVDDNERRYSMVKKLSLQMQALNAAKSGNLEVGLLREVLSEVRSVKSRHQHPAQAFAQGLSLPEVTTVADLRQLLIGSTWRKPNNLEHVIFTDNGVFYNNHAGHPKWRENSYVVNDDRLGVITVTWSVDGMVTECEFRNNFTEFYEFKNPTDGRWLLITTRPHTPSWGI